jgi:hypothetical protein
MMSHPRHHCYLRLELQYVKQFEDGLLQILLRAEQAPLMTWSDTQTEEKKHTAAQQFDRREAETATFLSRCLFTFGLCVADFAHGQFQRYALREV